MKFKRSFEKTAKSDGRVVYRRRQNVPVSVTIVSTSVTLENAGTSRDISYSLYLDDSLVAEGRGPADAPLVLSPNVRVPRGMREFLLVAEGFKAQQSVTGALQIDVSFF